MGVTVATQDDPARGVDLSYPGLYYPLADFPDQRWLKLALLNWDQIQRIRPEGYQELDRDLTRRIRELDPEALVDIQPDDDELWEVGERFEQLLRDAGPRLVDRYSISSIEDWPPTFFDSRPAGGDERLAFVYAASSAGDAAKMAYHIAHQLDYMGLGVVVQDSSGTWLGLHPRLASVYMCALTEAIAERRLLRPLTYDRRAHQASGRSTLDRLEQVLTGSPAVVPGLRSDEVEAQFVEVALAAVLQPVNLDELEATQIIDFRHEHGVELAAFHRYLRSLEGEFQELSQITNLSEIERRLGRLYRTDTEPRLRALEVGLRKFGIKTALSTLTMRIDAPHAASTLAGAATVVAGAAIGIGAAATVPLAVAMAIVPAIVAKRNERRQSKRESAVSYLLALRTEVQP